MARLLLVSPDASTGSPPSAPPLASLALLAHDVRVTLPDAHALTEAVRADAVLIDARRDLAAARLVCRLFTASGSGIPTLLILTEGGFATVTNEWGVSDVMLDSASPVELDARVRLLVSASVGEGVVSVGGITIDESAYHASLQGRQLDLTYTEFELLKYLVQHPGRVFSREQLLSDVWGYDYYGGTRTVDVHVRRLRAKLGPEHERLIGTVRNVGYRFSPEGGPRLAVEAPTGVEAQTG